MKKVLMHVCCAPCFITIEKDITKKGIIIGDKKEQVELTAFWYNPNIHPKIEYFKRKDSFEIYCKLTNTKNVVIDEYDMNEFVIDVVHLVSEEKEIKTRCEYCYIKRLEKTFKYASENGYDIVSTTLTRSPYQNHDLIKEVAEKLSKQYNVEYIYLDYRHTYYDGQKEAKELELYMQKYCGCTFSIDSGKWGY